MYTQSTDFKSNIDTQENLIQTVKKKMVQSSENDIVCGKNDENV